MKFLRNTLDKVEPLFEKGGKLERLYPVYEATDTFLYTPGHRTASGPHVRDGIDLKTRSLCTCAMLAALGRSTELKGHVRGAINNGATAVEIREVLLHSAIYAGAPAAIEAFRCAHEVLNELGVRIEDGR